MRNVMKTATLESQVPLLAVENGCIINKGCGHHRGIPGGTAGTLHADTGRIRGHAFHLGEGGQGIAELQHRAQSRTSSSKRVTGRTSARKT